MNLAPVACYPGHTRPGQRSRIGPPSPRVGRGGRCPS